MVSLISFTFRCKRELRDHLDHTLHFMDWGNRGLQRLSYLSRVTQIDVGGRASPKTPTHLLTLIKCLFHQPVWLLSWAGGLPQEMAYSLGLNQRSLYESQSNLTLCHLCLSGYSQQWDFQGFWVYKTQRNSNKRLHIEIKLCGILKGQIQ